ncbi:MAG: hypothetical protein Unbinned1606contig1000_52 [Prokaryotic dsDNA virus sp.]|nr:MAG: hypothetical protein Unbinned1606contig1000_52 [Prokaryotic dsDNA virus sp.]|tara:strand:+ start:28830 stop:29246 length:417 start_codon:yes stop_codon:yes gene_type:complete
MYLGRFQNGDSVPLRVRCVDANLDAINPDIAPNYVVYSDTFSDVATCAGVPPKDKDRLTGLFEDSLFLGSLDTGFYTVRYSWMAEGQEFATLDNFEIIGGGDASGAYTAMHFYGPPHADFIVGQLDSDTVDKRRNPKV